MLEPQSRRHLMEALRPPEGYELDRAIGTTFSLDLLALLVAPLSFTVFGLGSEDGSPDGDPLALFEGLRRYSDKISIYCQQGQISIPPTSHLLLGYLEKSVIEVSPKKRNRVFHPKVWALRFTSETPEERPNMYRLLVLSRNLTFDCSWDTVLVLEGEVSGKKRGDVVHPSLGDFFGKLPSLAVNGVPGNAQAAAKIVQDEIRRTHFAPPHGFESIRFWPLGMSQKDQWPFEGRVNRMLCVSPFLKKSLLDRLPGSSNGLLISRREEMDLLPAESVKRFGKSYFLSEEAELKDEISENESNEDAIAESRKASLSEDDEGTALRGLHAKLYVADSGWNARLWTGSANATNAAFSGNIEFLAELTGKKSFCGIDRIIGESGNGTGFINLLQCYEPPSENVDSDELREVLEGRADSVKRDILNLSLKATVGEQGSKDSYVVTLETEENDSVAAEMPEGISVRCWPITLKRDQAAQVSDLSAAAFAEFHLSLEAITSFFAFEVTVTEDVSAFSRRFCLNLRLSNAPEGREEAMVSKLLSDRGRVMRLILMLLAEGSPDERQLSLLLGRLGAEGNGTGGGGGIPDVPLFEELVRALWSNPEALDSIEKILETIGKSEQERELMPEELQEIWPQIMQARRTIRKRNI